MAGIGVGKMHVMYGDDNSRDVEWEVRATRLEKPLGPRMNDHDLSQLLRECQLINTKLRFVKTSLDKGESR